MADKQTIRIHKISQIWVYGADLRRIRYQNDISAAMIYTAMREKGYTYYDNKVYRFERKFKLYLVASEMLDLLDSYGVNYSI